MHDAEELLSMLRSLYASPDLQDFRPVLEEMMTGVKCPDHDNTERVIELFFKNLSDYHYRQIAETLWFISAMSITPKKWYELDD